ncbi:MAG: hypothetical protein R3Y63_04525 [Eubacteriales bacterium]
MNKELQKFDEDIVLHMVKDTSDLYAQQHANYLNGIGGVTLANKFTSEVEMWQWLHRNFESSGMFKNPKALKDYIKTSGDTCVKNLRHGIIQAKGYEWDWMLQERGKIENLLCRFDAGDQSNQIGIDVTKTNLLTGKKTTYQHKAYTSNGKIELKNTPRDTVVVTNSEKNR